MVLRSDPDEVMTCLLVQAFCLRGSCGKSSLWTSEVCDCVQFSLKCTFPPKCNEVSTLMFAIIYA